MNDDKNANQSTTSVIVLAAHRPHRDAAHPNFKTLIDCDLAAEAASREANRVSQTLASEILSLANLQPTALPKLLQRS